MHTGRIVFAQLMDLLPLHEFRKCVQCYNGDYKVRGFSCLDQFLCMAFAQLTYRESLRDIESCLRAMAPRLYHMGIRGRVSRSTLADANENRDWRIYADFAHVLIGIARPLYANEDFGVRLKQPAYAFDSTTIDLCLELFPWAQFRKTKAAVKLHTLLNLRGSIPEFIHITEGNVHDVNILDLLIIQAGSFYMLDRGYLDFERLYRIHQSGAFFVTRAKRNLDAQRRYSRPVNRCAGLRSDQTVFLVGIRSSHYYPEPLRRISYRDPQTDKYLRVPDKQLSPIGAYHRRAFQSPMASGDILQVDQAASAHQGVLRHFRKCGKDPSLDRCLRVRSGGYPEETAPIRPQSLHHSTGFECQPIRERTAPFLAFLEICRFLKERDIAESVAAIRSITGHY